MIKKEISRKSICHRLLMLLMVFVGVNKPFKVKAQSDAEKLAVVLPSELITPEIVSVNRMPMRATSFAFESKDLALKNRKEDSKNFLSLNGNWKFNWVQNPSKRPKDFYQTNFNDAGWKDFKVPANWEVNGYGLPIYVNHPYEFTGRKKMGGRLNPPFDIPADNNPVGSYRKKFTIPENWDDKQIFIHLGAVKSAFYIWVNGAKVGYSEDSKLAAEFDITNFVKPGENLVALEVYRWSDGSYLECQDMFRISGIERDVYVYATPKLDMRDFKVQAGLDEKYTDGRLSIDLTIENYRMDRRTNHSKADSFTVAAELLDAAGVSVWQEASSIQTVLGNYHKNWTAKTTVPNVKTWSAEMPNLYTLLFMLKNKNGEIVEVVSQKVGFRSIEIKGSDFLVNGKRIFLKGVNRHEHHPTNGHVLTKEDMRKDMEMMKKLNVNAVRHSHYPPDPYWMALCDEYGLYVVDEANIESHGRGYDLGVSFANDKQWRNPHFERIKRMYDRDKNHASVITWSLGNEAGNGANMYEAYHWLKDNDSRPVQYERAEWDYNTDIIVPQYPGPDWLPNYSKSKENRPLIMSEFAHIMGNSLGNYKEYWDAIESNPRLQGGFIWEWIDQGIDTVRNGKRFIAYGGDFPLEGPVNEDFSDNNFCVKGVVTAYRELTPMAIEIKKVHQFVKTTLTGEKQITVNNSYFFRNINNLQLNWTLLENGKAIEKGLIATLDLAPRKQKVFSIPYKKSLQAGKEYLLNISYTLKTAEPFLEAGYELAYEQFNLQKSESVDLSVAAKGKLKLLQTATTFQITGNKFSVSFDAQKGNMSEYVVNGATVLQKGPEQSYWRAPTDNDIGAGYNHKLRHWRLASQQGTLQTANATQQADGSVQVQFTRLLLDGDASETQIFTIFGNGTIKVENAFKGIKGNHALLLRMGNNLELNQAFSKIAFYGRGPWENYWDRKTASLVGIYQQTVSNQYFPYARPQESGNKSDVRWVNFTNAKGKGIQFAYADSLLNFSALPYSLDDLDPETEKKQYHSGELEPRDRIYLHIDLQQSGLQGIDSWGSQPLKQYRIPFANHAYSYWIRPV